MEMLRVLETSVVNVPRSHRVVDAIDNDRLALTHLAIMQSYTGIRIPEETGDPSSRPRFLN